MELRCSKVIVFFHCSQLKTTFQCLQLCFRVSFWIAHCSLTMHRSTRITQRSYSHYATGDRKVLKVVPPATLNDNYLILHEEVEVALKPLDRRKSSRLDYFPVELMPEAIINVPMSLCDNIWQTGQWPTTWIQPLVITLPMKVNPQIYHHKALNTYSWPRNAKERR